MTRVVTPQDSRAETLGARLANVEQCLREARAPDVRAFLYGIHEELRAEMAALRPPEDDELPRLDSNQQPSG